MVTLILGPVRGGKSARAAALARASGRRVVFVATAALDPSDAEMRDRVERHRRERPPSWALVETGLPDSPSLVALLHHATDDMCVVIDSLGTWVAAQLLALEQQLERDPVAALAAIDALGTAVADALAITTAQVVVVAEEAGWGVVPPSRLGRFFRDALGRLSQRIAQRAGRVELVVAGYAIDVRALGVPIDRV